jgi:hypothetical protein
VSWSLDAHDLDLLAVQADERLLTAVGARRQVEVADPVIAVLSALAREVDVRPIPTGRLAGLRLVGQPTGGAGRRANRRAALTGVAAAVAVLSIGGVAAAVGGTPVSSVIRDTVGSVFDGGSGPSTAELVSAKLGDAKAALDRGDAQQAKQILEDIKAQVDGSDPGEVPASLIAQVKDLESKVDAAEVPQEPVVTPSPPAVVPPAGTIGGDASQPAGSETDSNGNGNGANQGQGQEKHDGATPTSEPTSTPESSDPADPSATPSPDPTSSPSPADEDHATHGNGPKQQDSGESALGAGGTATASPSVKEGRGKLSPGSEGKHKGVDKGSSDQAASYALAEQAAASTAP